MTRAIKAILLPFPEDLLQNSLWDYGDEQSCCRYLSV